MSNNEIVIIGNNENCNNNVITGNDNNAIIKFVITGNITIIIGINEIVIMSNNGKQWIIIHHLFEEKCCSV